jgi:signal transduction histidine kinase
MILKRTFLAVLSRVALITISSLLFAWLLMGHYGLDLVIATGVLIVVQAWLLVRYLNRVNRKLSFFFQSLLNEDTSFRLPGNSEDPMEKELHRSMNQVNQKLEAIRVRAREKELKFQAVVEQAVSGLLAFDSQGFVFVTNSATLQMLGLDVLTHIKQLSRVSTQLFELVVDIKDGETRVFNYALGRESKILAIKASSLLLNQSTLTLLSVVDIKPEFDARETDSWIKLTKALTHEIMNGIAPITSVSKTVLGYFEKGNQVVCPHDIDNQLIEKAIKGLRVIYEQGQSLNSFVNHFRQFSKIPQPVQRIVEITSFLDRIRLVNLELVEQGCLTICQAVGSYSIFIDENLMAQAIAILVANANDAIKGSPGGSITIRAYALSNGKATIDVSDNGMGIPPGIINDIFIPFFSTKKNGTGIGLSIARQIVHLHGGSLTVESEVGVGSTFRITI